MPGVFSVAWTKTRRIRVDCHCVIQDAHGTHDAPSQFDPPLMQVTPSDAVSRKGLVALVKRRRFLLETLRQRDNERWLATTESLGLRQRPEVSGQWGSPFNDWHLAARRARRRARGKQRQARIEAQQREQSEKPEVEPRGMEEKPGRSGSSNSARST